MKMSPSPLARAIVLLGVLWIFPISCIAANQNNNFIKRYHEDVRIPNTEHIIPLAFHRRDDVLSGPNATIAANSTLADALKIVKAAQSEAHDRNARLVANPRRNTYEFRSGAPSQVSQVQGDGTVSTTTSDGTGVNATVAEAAAVVAEALAKNSTASVSQVKKRAGNYWMENMVQNGASPYAPPGYKVWRNVKDYGALGDGIHDDTDAINLAISDQTRCGQACGSTTTLQAVVYFPAGTYLVSHSIIAYYFTQMIGDATNPPTIKVSQSFSGLGVISSDVYIEGGDGASWYINQSNFYRQVRNFIIDMTNAPLFDFVAGIHWQIAQATSLQNIKFRMSSVAGNNQQGIYMENGSGGFMGDLEFTGGALGAYVGNQQFTVRGLKFSNQLGRALEIHWDWGWTWKSVQIENTPIGVVMWGPSPNDLGSAIFIDSSFTNVPVGLQLQAPGNSYGRITLNLFSVAITNVPIVVKVDSGQTLLAGTGGSQTIAAWGLGKRYDSDNGEETGVWQSGANYDRLPKISPSLLKVPGNPTSGFYERSKPQYEGLPASQFFNIKLGPYNAVGNGVADDTAALNAALAESASSGRVLWIPAGVYIVTNTITIPPGAKVVGQSWSQIMGSGSLFSNINNPHPVVKVGNVGDVGTVEIQDLLFTVRGGTAGAIVLQWNIHESSPGAAAMWDTHIRVGGAAGSNLQVGNCPKLTGSINPNCIAASMLVHITSKASAYFENTWFWVADHDLDIPAQTQIDIFVGRGVLVESSGPVWFYGTASEHCVLYQYQFANAANIFMGMIQTESPYFQAAPAAPAPFTPSTFFPLDPTFGHCATGSPTCAFSWAVRIINSVDIFIYGAGLYSWFQQYTQACVATDNCQDRIFEISSSSSIWIYSLITKASIEMISPDGGVSVLGQDNQVNFCNIVMAWMGSAGGSGGSSSGGAIHRSPASATVIPFPATSVGPTSTFSVVGPVVSQVDYTPNGGNQNLPPGPGPAQCPLCDLGRLLTSTCCGIGGGISNPIEIGPGVAVPRPMILPPGFIPDQQVPGIDGVVYPAGKPLPKEVIIPVGTIFPFPFKIPPGLPLSDTWSPKPDEDDDDGKLYLAPDFWDGLRSVQCSFPCTLVFPPMTTTTTWDPPPVTITTGSITTTTDPPPYTTQLIRISKTTIVSEQGSQPTKTVQPEAGPKPLCFTLNLILFTIQICPPNLSPFPPPIPMITIGPLPPGGRPWPTNTNNKPTPEQEQSEDEEDEEDDDGEEDGGVCPLVDFVADDEDDYDVTGGTSPGSGEANQPPGYNPPAAGTGNAATVVVTATVETTRTVTNDVTVTIAPPPKPTNPVQPPPSTPVPKTPNRNDETYICFWSGTWGNTGTWKPHGQEFCRNFAGQELNAMPGAPADATWRAWSYNWDFSGFAWTYVRVDAQPGCKFKIDRADCERIMDKLGTQCWYWGGHMEGNCAFWLLDPGSHLAGQEGSAPPGNYPDGRNP